MRRNTRRSFMRNALRAAGGIVVGLPMLESIGTARAGTLPVRYLQFMHPQGTLIGEWSPGGTVNAMQLSAILAPLEAHKSELVVCSGIDNPAAGEYGSNGHISSGRTVFTCATNSGNADLAAGPSIDQVIADRLAAPTPYKSLQFGVGGPEIGEYQALYAGPADPVPLDGDPQAIFDQLFSELETDPDAPTTALQRLRARRVSVLDTVKDQFDGLQARVSARDRETLEKHADKIRELELQLGNEGEAGVGCTTPMMELPEGYDFRDRAQDDVSSRVMLDLMVMAMACDMTRVGTLQYTHYHDPNYPWLGDVLLGYPEWHSLVHDVPNIADLSTVRSVFAWYMGELDYLVGELAAMPDGEGRLLDNMLVLATSELGDGATHATTPLPVVLAGQCGGKLATGRHLGLQGARLGELYLTFLGMFGADDTVFGNPVHCSGPLTL